MRLSKLALSLPLLLAILPACGGGAEDYLGEWEVQMETPELALESPPAGAQGELGAALGAFAEEASASLPDDLQVTLEVKEDETFVMSMRMQMMGQPMSQTQRGTWSLSGGELVLRAEGQDERATARLVDGGLQLEMESEEDPLVLARKE